MQTSQTRTQPSARPGLLYGTGPWFKITKFSTAATSGGLFVCRDAADGKCKAPTSDSEVQDTGFGFIVYDAAKPPADGATTDYSAGEDLAVVEMGAIWALAEEAMAIGDAVYVRHTANGTGKLTLGAVRNDSDSSNAALLQGCRVLLGCSVAGPVLVYLEGLAKQVSVTALAAEIAGMQGDGFINIPLATWRLAADGAAIPAFGNGTADGMTVVSSEAFGLRINDDSTTHFATSVLIPPDLDDTADVMLNFLGFRVGTADAANAKLTLNAFIVGVTDADNADTDILTADTDAFAAATTIVSQVTATLPLADVPASPAVLTLDMVVSSAMTTDDLVIMASWLSYTKKVA